MADSYALTETTYYILLALTVPRHGYGIMQVVEEYSGRRIRLAAGTLYGALNALCDKGWIVLLPLQSGSRRKEYRITEDGLMILKEEIARLKELMRMAKPFSKEKK